MRIDPSALTPDEVAHDWFVRWSPEHRGTEPSYEYELFHTDLEPKTWLWAVVAALNMIPEDDGGANLVGVLAAGPLEDLLAKHGPEVIELVELLAKNRPNFAYLLGGVWRNSIRQDVWDRVQAALPERW